MGPERAVLVVGTTPDYVDWIRRSRPGEAVFLTDPVARANAIEDRPAPGEELLCDLTDYPGASRALAEHLDRHGLALDGVACFDCESLELAAVLAREHGLPYPTVEAIALCRDKQLSKERWRRDGLRCPASAEIGSAEDAARLAAAIAGPVVLKPATGSGSELLLVCRGAAECAAGLAQIRRGLAERATNRLYLERPAVVAEELVDGDEYSCDFLVEEGRVTLIRLTRKVLAPTGPPGTARAYVLTDPPPAGIERQGFLDVLLESARSLGITRGLNMLDFIVRDGRMFLLELTPRPGGDCLPWLLEHARGLDMLALTLDFARRRPIRIAADPDRATHAALRVHAPRSGIVARIDDAALRTDPRVLAIEWLRGPGHVVRMPPEDYASWLLGQVLFVPDPGRGVDEQCAELLERIRLEIEG